MFNQLSTHGERAANTGGLAEIRARVLEQARQEPSLTRTKTHRQRRFVMWTVAIVSLLGFLASGGIRIAPRPDRLVLETSLGAAVIGLGAAAIALRRGKSMLGAAASRLLAVALLTPVGLFAWKLFATAQLPNMMDEWSERPGLRCLVLGLALSLAPLWGLMWIRRGSEPTHPRLAGAAIGASVGAGSWVLVDLWCPVGYVQHLMLGHVLPLIVVIVASTALGGRVLAIRVNEVTCEYPRR